MSQAPARRVTPTFFSEGSPLITPQESAALVAALHDVGLLDNAGWLTADPKQFDNKCAGLPCVCMHGGGRGRVRGRQADRRGAPTVTTPPAVCCPLCRWIKKAYNWPLKVAALLPSSMVGGAPAPGAAINFDLRRSHVLQLLNIAFARHENLPGG